MLSLVLGSYLGEDRFRGTIAKEYLALAVNNVLLEIHCNRFSGAEILHCLGYLDPQVRAKPIESVYSMAGGKNDGCVIQDVDPLGPELPGRKRLYEEKLPESDVNAIFLLQCVVRSLIKRRTLGYQYLFNGHIQSLNLPIHQSRTAEMTKAAVGSNSRLQRYKNVVKGLQAEAKICPRRMMKNK